MMRNWPVEIPERQQLITMFKVYELVLVTIFVVLSALSSYLLWITMGWRVSVQVVIIMIVGAVGEHYISGQGYYYYTKSKHNGFFIGRVPLWIPFMWVFVVQGALVISLAVGLPAVGAIVASGLLCLVLDLVVIEPVLSRKRALWAWTSVEGGYLGFIPSQIDRFTAPPGNYLVWLIFPIITNWVLYGLLILFPG